MQLGKMVGLLPIADATSRIDLSSPWAYQGPLHMQDVVHVDAWWQWAFALGFQRKRNTGACAWPAASVTRLWMRSWLYFSIHTACSPVAISGVCARGISLRAVRKKRAIFPLYCGYCGGA